MKLNIECVRDVLLEFEALPIGVYSVSSFKNSIAKYGEKDVTYSLFKLYEAEYINASEDSGMTQDGQPHISAIYDITFRGHEFLANIKPKSNWDKLSSVFKQVGSVSFQVASNVATELATNTIIAMLKR